MLIFIKMYVMLYNRRLRTTINRRAIMSSKATCMFCYSWDNDDMFPFLVFLKNTIEQKSKNTVKVILDKLSFKYNDDLRKHLDKMKDYDLIVPFFTPEFKSLLLSGAQDDRAYIKEYRVIEERFEEDKDSIFPVVLAGNMDTSVPKIFNKKICPFVSDMNLQLNKDGNVFVPADSQFVFDKFIRELIGQVRVNFAKNSTEYKTEREALEKLFYLNNTSQLPNSCLIKIDAYDIIIKQSAWIVVGRKGSGKTTFLKNLNKIDSDSYNASYKELAPICADNLNLDHIYKVVSKYHADKIEIPLKDIIVLFWQVLFVLHSIYVIGIEEEDDKIDGKERAIKFQNVSNKLKELLALKTPKSGQYLSFRRDGVLRQLSVTAIDFIDDYFAIALQNANPNNLIASILGMLTPSNILSNKFGNELLDDFIVSFEECSKKILISIDGFDKESETFRRMTQSYDKDSIEYINRLNFEITFYSQLLEVASDYKFETYQDVLQNVIKEHLAFCIVLPKDRYDQIVKLDRDSAKKHFCSLDWDQYELMKLVTHRLEYLIRKNNGGGFNFPKFNSLKERFYYAIKTYCPNIPDTVYININGNKFSFDLFNYILRLSFWRPRDVISHFSKIIPLFKEESKDDDDLKNEILKLTLKAGAREIIKNEFIKEYENVFINLNEVLHAFDEQNIIMTANDFIKILANTKFYTTFAYDLNKIPNRLYVLYQLGVIGLYYDENSFKKCGYRHRLCYIYNEGLEPIENFIQKNNFDMSNPKIIFNTILVEHLSLNINTTELIGNYDWEYIDMVHKLKPSIRRI